MICGMSWQIDFQPVGRRAEGQKGQSVLEIARQAGVGIASLCGGQGVCGACRVQILEGDVSPPTALERETLSPEELAAGYRLACLARPQGNVQVHIPPRSLTTEQRLQIEGQSLPTEVARSLLVVMRRGSLSAAEEITGHKYETIGRWLRAAAQQAEVITEVLVRDLHLTGVEVDAFWSFVKKSVQMLLFRGHVKKDPRD